MIPYISSKAKPSVGWDSVGSIAIDVIISYKKLLWRIMIFPFGMVESVTTCFDALSIEVAAG